MYLILHFISQSFELIFRWIFKFFFFYINHSYIYWNTLKARLNYLFIKHQISYVNNKVRLYSYILAILIYISTTRLVIWLTILLSHKIFFLDIHSLAPCYRWSIFHFSVLLYNSLYYHYTWYICIYYIYIYTFVPDIY